MCLQQPPQQINSTTTCTQAVATGMTVLANEFAASKQGLVLLIKHIEGCITVCSIVYS